MSQKESEWEIRFDENFGKNGGYLCQYDPDAETHTSNPEEVKAFIRETLSNREKEIADEVEKFMPADREVNYHSSYSEGKIDMAEKVLQIIKH